MPSLFMKTHGSTILHCSEWALIQGSPSKFVQEGWGTGSLAGNGEENEESLKKIMKSHLKK